MVTTISGPSTSATPVELNGSSTAANGLLGEPPVAGAANGSRSRTESRRASNQSKELSELELPAPSRLDERPRPLGLAPRTSDGLLTTSADVDQSPFVRSIPSSPYLGSTSPGLGSVPKFGDTTQYDELVKKLQSLDLPAPEILDEDSRWSLEEKERVASEMQDILANMDLSDPEKVTRAIMRAQGIKTPEPTSQAPGEAVSTDLARKRTITQKNKNEQNVDKA